MGIDGASLLSSRLHLDAVSAGLYGILRLDTVNKQIGMSIEVLVFG